MNHPFNPSDLDTTKCKACGYDRLAHTKAALCEACDKRAEVEPYPHARHPKAMLLCNNCIQKEKDANTVIIAQTQVAIIEKSKEIDIATKLNGDIWNAQTISNHELHVSVMSGEGNEQEKLQKFIGLMITRIETLGAVIKSKKDDLHNEMVKQRANIETMRAFGSSIREAERERIKASDDTYQPHKPPVKPVVVKAISAHERIVQNVMKSKNISRDEAIEVMKKAGLA